MTEVYQIVPGDLISWSFDYIVISMKRSCETHYVCDLIRVFDFKFLIDQTVHVDSLLRHIHYENS